VHALRKKTLGLGHHPALLVVDACCAFTDPASPLGSDFNDEIQAIQKLMSLAEELMWPRLFSTVWYETEDEARIFREKLPDLNALQKGSAEVLIDPRLPVSNQDRVFRKTHASCFFGTHLDRQLREINIDSLIIAGFTTSGCVRASVVDALQYGYRTAVVEDAVGDRDRNAHHANLYDMQAKYADVVSLEKIRSLIDDPEFTPRGSL
jgi:nicotinamidase-related amidase